MRLVTVASCEYPGVLAVLLKKRLSLRLPMCAPLVLKNGSVLVSAADEDIPRLALALAELITMDLRGFETARLIGRLPVGLRDRQRLLPMALSAGEPDRFTEYAAEELKAYLEKHSFITAEGFLRFRLQRVTEEWAIAVDAAAEELLLRREYQSIIRLLGVVSDAENASSMPKRVRLILNADGSSAVSDERGCRIESTSSEGAELLGILLGLSPDTIEVYDLTEGGRPILIDSIRAVFGSKAQVFVISGRG